jgi:MoxR-like ATPase
MTTGDVDMGGGYIRYCGGMREELTGPLRLATDRFVAFFRELEGAFVERQDLLQQIALALLSRQHVLMTGPPGTAKSQLAHAVLGRIVSEDTGRPSLFARQFTESTVQTDLVGPIDFKTLMETGRTEHFTDEGILGAVHAFLDEVFDGRDMLLRSTLNVLQERELKEGTKTTHGRIECALMTTNRYLAEILDNERLVAFVDRIAFLSFVPKGFATPSALEAVLLAQVAGRKPPDLVAPLTIQDLDLLQGAVEDVYVDDAVCASLAELVRAFEAELHAAHRADPTFVPSRYLSTRTAVRLGGLLRAICFADRAFNDPGRPLEVMPRDLAKLRLAMTLCGPSAVEAVKLLAAEPDPRERRQLAIVRTEREIFDKCLAALSARPDRPAQSPAGRALDDKLLAASEPAALRKHTGARLLELSRELAVAASSGRRDADRARDALDAVLDELVARALRTGLLAAATDEAEPVALVSSLAALAREVEGAGKAHARAARWLRARALEVADNGVEMNAVRIGKVLSTLVVSSGDLASMRQTLEAVLGRAEELVRLRDGLRHAGADEDDARGRDGVWSAAAARLAEGIVPVLAAGLPRVAAALAPRDRRKWELEECLAALEPVLAFARECGVRLTFLGAGGVPVFARLVGPLVAPLARDAFDRAGVGAPDAVAAHLERQMAALAGAGVLQVLPPADLVAWASSALLRAGGAPPTAPHAALDLDGYRALRAELARGTLAAFIVDFYLRVVTGRGEDPLDPDLVVRRVAEVVAAFPADAREPLARRDLAQLEADVGYLERWWAEIAAVLPAAARPALERLVASRFFQLTHDEGALTRFALEARLVGMVFGRERVAALLDRAAALERASAATAQRLMAEPSGGPATFP